MSTSERQGFTVQNKYSAEALAKLRADVKALMSEKRYGHTLAVEEEAVYIAGFVLPEKTDMLRAAALLHDIAKELSSEKQLNYIERFDIITDSAKDVPPAVMHAAAAPGAVAELFSDYADPEILSAVRWHTTGRRGMTVFDAVIFIADYTEATRRYDSCRKCREMLHTSLDKSRDRDEAVRALADAVGMSLADTLMHVKEKGSALDCDTVEALRFIEEGNLPV